jgi:transcription elongation factor GreB
LHLIMSRWSMKPRPPKGPTRAASGSTTNLITARGYAMLSAELEQLWKVERPKVTQEVADAAAHGDRSENAEYIYGKKRLREIDRRLRFLSKRLDVLEVVRPAPEQRGRVFFGAEVTVEDEQGQEASYQIVGPDEYDLKQGRISVDSPMARALLGKREGDEVRVQRPRGPAQVTIVEIRYDLDAPSAK